MNVTREVILDLVPLVIAGEASPESCALVEEYLRQDPELAERVRVLRSEGLAPGPSVALPPDLELKALRRTRRLLALQRWLFGLGIGFTAIALGIRIEHQGYRITRISLLLSEEPGLGILLAAGLGLLLGYVLIRRRLRSPKP